MRLTWWSGGKGYEPTVSAALASGARICGDEIVLRHTADYREPDGPAVIAGVSKHELLHDHQTARVPFLFIDKGYWRTRAPWHGGTPPEWWRLVVNATQPTEYLQEIRRPGDRWAMLGVDIKPRRTDGYRILIAGSSHKFHLAHHLSDPTVWTADLVTELRRYTDRPITYRPKPSWAMAQAVAGTDFDHGAGKSVFGDKLSDAWCVVTYGSMACVEAIVAGIPVIVLGNAVARPISSTDLAEIETPRWAADEERRQWAADLAYCHFRLAELADGSAWRIIRDRLAA